MTDNPTPDEVRASIVPKSDQLNTEDLLTGPITITVAGVRRGSKEQPIIIDLKERDRPYKPCKTCRRCLIAIWSDDPKKWVGQTITLFADPSVVYAGVKVGGLRISHMSGIDEPRTFMLTKTRGKKAEVTIHPIAKLSREDQKFISEATEELTTAESLDVLNGYGQVLKTKSKSVQDAMRPVYAKRLDELKQLPKELA